MVSKRIAPMLVTPFGTDACQAGTESERVLPDAGEVLGDRHIGQAGAGIEGRVSNDADTVRDRNAGHVRAVLESAGSDVGEAIAHCEARQGGAGIERLLPDAGNRQTIDLARHGHRPTGTGVFGDGNRAIFGRVVVAAFALQRRRGTVAGIRIAD